MIMVTCVVWFLWMYLVALRAVWLYTVQGMTPLLVLLLVSVSGNLPFSSR